MKELLLTLSSVFIVTLLATPTLGAGWIWDIANGIGFAAFAGLLYLSVSSGNGIDLQAHQFLGYAVLGIATAHALVFLLVDAAAIEYIKPGAPFYMWMGIAGFVLLNLLIFVGLPEYRLRLHRRYANFKYWHRILAIATIVAAAYHIASSGFYLNTSYQLVLFVCLVALVVSGNRKIASGVTVTRRTARLFLAASTIFALLFAAIRNVSL